MLVRRAETRREEGGKGGTYRHGCGWFLVKSFAHVFGARKNPQ
jgi:hypothetical protein